MNSKKKIINGVCDILTKVGFYVSPLLHMSGRSFDIIARRDNILIFVKVILNIDNLKEADMNALYKIATTLDASPIVIGSHAGYTEIENGIIYMRFNIPVVTIETLRDLLLEGVPPFLFSAHGGVFAKVDGESLRNIMNERGISLGAMAEAVGVSRKTIQLYEEGGGGRIDIIERIETFIQTAIVKPLNPLLFSEINKNITYTESCNENEGMDDFGGIGEVFRIITSKGVKIIPLRKCPFDGVMIIGNKYLTTIGSKNELKVRTKIVFPVSRIIERIPLAIVTDQYANDSKAINGVPVITKNEMSDINESVELMDLIKMRIVKI